MAVIKNRDKVYDFISVATYNLCSKIYLVVRLDSGNITYQLLKVKGASIRAQCNCII